MTDARITLRFDGGSRGNPGPAGIGVVLEADDGTTLFSVGRFIGSATNNVAEYKALIAGLEAARQLGVKKLRVLGDSELVIKQLLGEYRVKNETLKPLFEQAKSLLATFALPEVGHNRRVHNSLADKLANLAMDKRKEVSDADLPAGGVDNPSEEGPGVELPGGSSSTGTQECPRCNCRIRIDSEGEIPAKPRRFICRCGTPMRPVT